MLEILREVGNDLRADPQVGRLILDPLEILGIETPYPARPPEQKVD